MPRASVAMQPVAERVSVLETKVENIDEKLDDLKSDVKDLHDCLDRTRDTLKEQLDTMLIEYRQNRDRFYEHADTIHKENQEAHKTMATKVIELEKFKNKWVLYTIAGLAFLAGTGWIGHTDIPKVIKMFIG